MDDKWRKLLSDQYIGTQNIKNAFNNSSSNSEVSGAVNIFSFKTGILTFLEPGDAYF